MTLECLASNPFKTTRSIRITSTSAAFMCACFFMFYVCQVPAFFMCVKYPPSLCVSSVGFVDVCQVSAIVLVCVSRFPRVSHCVFCIKFIFLAFFVSSINTRICICSINSWIAINSPTLVRLFRLFKSLNILYWITVV